MNQSKVELDQLPEAPFTIMFLDEEGRRFPRKMFTVSEKRININKNAIDLYVVEEKRYMVYNKERVAIIGENPPN